MKQFENGHILFLFLFFVIVKMENMGGSEHFLRLTDSFIIIIIIIIIFIFFMRS